VSAASPPATTVEQIDLGRPIAGPTATGSDFRRFVHLTRTLAVTDFKLRFFGSALGYLWQLMRPLMLFGVLYFVFSEFLKFGGDVRFYPQSLLLGIVMYSFLSEATSMAVRSLMQREPLVRKIDFPRLAVPLASVLTALFNLVLNLIPVFVFLLAAGGTVRWSWLELPVILAFLLVFVLGLAMLLSALFVRYRDIEPIWDVTLQIFFYASPIFYTVQTIIDKAGISWARVLLCNPFATALQQARHAVIDPSHVSTAHAFGSQAWLAIPGLITVAVFALGFFTFRREAPRIAEEL
jgi:ABC-2 type transport system permease protein